MKRTDKVSHEIQRTVSSIIQEEVDDPNLGMLSIVRVEVSADMRNATLYFSVFPEEMIVSAQNALARMKSVIRAELAHRVKLRYVPELHFCPDEGIRQSVYINKKIEEINDEFGTGS